MHPIVVLLAFMIVPVIFTAWGWRHIIIPIGVPIAKMAWWSLIVIIWLGFAVGVTQSGWFYRAFGFCPAWTFLEAFSPNPQQVRWKLENSVRPDGGWEPNWREIEGYDPLPPNWDGTPKSLLPAWSFPIVCVGIGIAGLKMRRRQAQKQRSKEWAWTPMLREWQARETTRLAFPLWPHGAPMPGDLPDEPAPDTVVRARWEMAMTAAGATHADIQLIGPFMNGPLSTQVQTGKMLLQRLREKGSILA